MAKSSFAGKSDKRKTEARMFSDSKRLTGICLLYHILIHSLSPSIYIYIYVNYSIYYKVYVIYYMLNSSTFAGFGLWDFRDFMLQFGSLPSSILI